MTPPHFQFAQFPALETTRLVLRELLAGDEVDVLAFRGDAEVQRFNSEPLLTLDDAKAFIAEQRREFDNKARVTWGVVDPGRNQVIGTCSLGPLNLWHGWASLGYDLRRDRWGLGLAQEAAICVMQFGFDQIGLRRIEAATIADNVRSIRMLEALGFRREGLRRECSLEDDGKYHDSAIYGILASELGTGQTGPFR